MVRPNIAVSEDWLQIHVVPHISNHFPKGVATVLGHALLWAVYDENMSTILDAALVDRVREEMMVRLPATG